MKGVLMVGAALGLGIVVFAAGIEAAQRGWVLPLKGTVALTPSSRSEAITARPRASIAGDANGVYCTSPSENGVGIHDLGAIPAGLRVVVTVESFSEGFNPVAAVMVPTLGERAANSLRVTNFYDNDSGGDNDARIDFVAPQNGVYILLVGDFSDKAVGCYRYQAAIGT